MLSLQDKIEIVLISGENRTNREVANIFNTRHPNQNVNHTTVGRILNKFRATGSVANIVVKERAKNVTNEDNSLQVLGSIVEKGQTSLRIVAEQCDMSRNSVHRILKRNKFHPYRPTFISTLKERDLPARFDFCIWYQGQLEEDRDFYKKIIWLDEATFTSNGTVSSQTCRWWADENPHFAIETRDQYSFKTNVLCCIYHNKIIGPFFFRENLNAERFRLFLERDLANELDNLPLNIRPSIWLQLDGASVHCTIENRAVIDEMFSGRWLGRHSEYEWPARSPDLTPLDFFLWGYLKQLVYRFRPFANIDELEQRIRECVGSISKEMIVNAVKRVSKKTEKCLERNGGHTEMD